MIFATLAGLVACGGLPRSPGGRASPSPSGDLRLVVLLVVDQWPEWSFEAKRSALTGGFDRLLRDGEWHVGTYPHAATITAAGHALLGTGALPHRSGILANEWWRRGVERSLKSVEGEDGAATAGWLRVAGLADALVRARPTGKAVSVSLKDRSAILTLGRAGTPIWYDAERPAWTSTAPVPWLAAWNTARPIAAHLGAEWTPLPETARLAGIADDAPGERGWHGLGPSFPHRLAASADPAGALFATPIGNDIVLDTATEAIDRTPLGASGQPDLLVISLSAHDYIGHGWGQESWESWDAVLRLDRRLDRFLTDLDARLGPGGWALIATSDHGASPMPESLGGGRISLDQLKRAANNAAIAELGPGDWVASVRYPTLYLSRAALAQKPRDLAAAVTKIVYALRSFPGIERVERSADLWGNCETRTGDARALCQSLDPERSGEVMFLPARGWIFQGDEAVATGHGSLHRYDRQVPVILLPPGRVSHAARTGPDKIEIEMSEITGVIASWLGVAPPTTLPAP